MNTINFNVRALRAVARAMAHKDVRYYLNGVLFKATSDKAGGPLRLVLTATDGHRVHFTRDTGSTGDMDALPAGGLILTDASVKAVLKAAGRKVQWAHLLFDVKDSSYAVLLHETRVKLTVEVHEGRYPDTHCVVPPAERLERGKPTQVNANYIADAMAAVQDLAPNRPYPPVRLTWSEFNWCALACDDEITLGVVIMGLRESAHSDLPLSLLAASC